MKFIYACINSILNLSVDLAKNRVSISATRSLSTHSVRARTGNKAAVEATELISENADIFFSPPGFHQVAVKTPASSKAASQVI